MRRRRTKAQIDQLWKQMFEVLATDHPQSVRHVFYRMTDPRLPEPVEKTEKGYTTVQRQLVKMRRTGLVRYDWITDSTRRGYFVNTYETGADFIKRVAGLYRQNLWDQVPVYLEVWCESRSIAGVIQEETATYAVPLYPSGGFSSLTLLYEAAEYINQVAEGRPVHVLYVGDYDPAGVLIDNQIKTELEDQLSQVDKFHFHRLAVTPEQIDLMGLPTKPPKDNRGGWKKDQGTVEAEAIPAAAMRQILREAIEAFIDPRVLKVTEEAERSERSKLFDLAYRMEA